MIRDMRKPIFILIAILSLGVSQTSRTAEIDPMPAMVKLVTKLQPKLNDIDAIKLAYAIRDVYKSEDRDTVPWNVLLAIAMQESSLFKAAVGKITKDLGLMQFSQRNINKMKLDRKRLTQDETYALSEGLKLLRKHKTILKKYPYWIGSYNQGLKFKDPEVRAKAMVYNKSVMRKATKIKKLYDAELMSWVSK